MTYIAKRLTPGEETALFLSQGFVFQMVNHETISRIDGMDKQIINAWFGELASILKNAPYHLITVACNTIMVAQKIYYQTGRSEDGTAWLDYQTIAHFTKLLKELMNGGGQQLVDDIIHALNWAVYQHSIGGLGQ